MLDDENPRYRKCTNEQFFGCGMTYPKCQARYMHQIIDDLARAFVDAKRSGEGAGREGGDYD